MPDLAIVVFLLLAAVLSGCSANHIAVYPQFNGLPSGKPFLFLPAAIPSIQQIQSTKACVQLPHVNRTDRPIAFYAASPPRRSNTTDIISTCGSMRQSPSQRLTGVWGRNAVAGRKRFSLRSLKTKRIADESTAKNRRVGARRTTGLCCSVAEASLTGEGIATNSMADDRRACAAVYGSCSR